MALSFLRTFQLISKPTKVGEPAEFFQTVVLDYDGSECLIWPYSRHGAGYGTIRKDGRTATVSRLVCEYVHGPAPTPAHEAAHSCGNGHLGCVAKNHLSWKTPLENNLDKIEHGTIMRGEKHHSAKLTQEQVREIMKLRGTMTQAEIGNIYGVSQMQISRIFRGKKWNWLTY